MQRPKRSSPLGGASTISPLTRCPGFSARPRTLANSRRSVHRQDALRRKITTHAAQRPPTGPEQEAVRAAEREDVRTALDHLSESDREILRLAAWDGLDAAEIGEVLGIPTERVSVRLYRAKKRLAREFAAIESGKGCPTRHENGGRR